MDHLSVSPLRVSSLRSPAGIWFSIWQLPLDVESHSRDPVTATIVLLVPYKTSAVTFLECRY